MNFRLIIVLLFLFILLTPLSAEVIRPGFVERLEYTGSLAPQFHAGGFGTSIEGGLFLHLEKVPRFKAYSTATLEIQYIETDIHGEFDIMFNLKGSGVVWENVLQAKSSPFLKLEEPFTVGSMVSLKLGGGLINYWRSEDSAYLPLPVLSLRPGAGLFIEGDNFMLNLDLCYQIDLSRASPRTFITLPVTFTLHKKPVFGE